MGTIWQMSVPRISRLTDTALSTVRNYPVRLLRGRRSLRAIEHMNDECLRQKTSLAFGIFGAMWLAERALRYSKRRRMAHLSKTWKLDLSSEERAVVAKIFWERVPMLRE
jgi:hypothetical protein